MRHFFFRLVLGVVFAICAIYSFITANIPFARIGLRLKRLMMILLLSANIGIGKKLTAT